MGRTPATEGRFGRGTSSRVTQEQFSWSTYTKPRYPLIVLSIRVALQSGPLYESTPRWSTRNIQPLNVVYVILAQKVPDKLIVFIGYVYEGPLEIRLYWWEIERVPMGEDSQRSLFLWVCDGLVTRVSKQT